MIWQLWPRHLTGKSLSHHPFCCSLPPNNGRHWKALRRGLGIQPQPSYSSYVEEGINAHTGTQWYPQALETAISKAPHASACTLEMTTFIGGEMKRRINDGFSILLPAADVVQLFGEKMKISRIATVPQAHRHPRLILNLSEKPDVVMPSVNYTTSREAATELLKFSRASPRILQALW